MFYEILLAHRILGRFFHDFLLQIVTVHQAVEQLLVPRSKRKIDQGFPLDAVRFLHEQHLFPLDVSGRHHYMAVHLRNPYHVIEYVVRIAVVCDNIAVLLKRQPLLQGIPYKKNLLPKSQHPVSPF
ncbi:hypothetical protein D3C73_1349450 [compost metagenome]